MWALNVMFRVSWMNLCRGIVFLILVPFDSYSIEVSLHTNTRPAVIKSIYMQTKDTDEVDDGRSHAVFARIIFTARYLCPGPATLSTSHD